MIDNKENVDENPKKKREVDTRKGHISERKTKPNEA